MGFNWSWVSPWTPALLHITKVGNELSVQIKGGNEGAEKLLEEVLDITARYHNGERSTKLYFDMFRLSVKGIKKYVK